MPLWTFINTDFVPDHNASLPIRDLAFQRAYGIFDFFRLVSDRPVWLCEHLERFYFSAEEMRLPIPYTRAELEYIVHQLISLNQSRDKGIRLSLTGGVSENGISIGQPNLVISEHPLILPSSGQMKQGIRLLTYQHQRQLPHVKTIDYIMPLWLQPLMDQNGVNDVLYHSLGKITECPRSNFFLVTKDNKIITAADHILKGVTRNKVIALAKVFCEVEERDILLEEISTAKEAFITSTTKKVLPVASIDGINFEIRNDNLSFQLLKEFESFFRQEE